MLKLLQFCWHLLTDPHHLVRSHDPAYQNRLMSFREKGKLFSPKNKGICVNGKDRLSIPHSLTHCLVQGGTGWGKTSSVIIPTILQAQHSCVVVDVDGAIFQKTAGYKQQQGFNIQTLNFADSLQSHYYNPLTLCQTDTDRKQLAETLVQTAYPNANGESLFWNQGAVTVLYLLLRLLKTQEEKYQNLSNLLYLLTLFPKLKNFIASHATHEVWTDYLGFQSSDEKVRSSHIATARVALDKLSNPVVAQITAKNTLDFEELTQEKTILYLIVPETKLNFFSFLLSIFFTQLFEYVQLNRPKQPIFFLLDEFAHYHIPNFTTLATTLRRYHCSLTLIVQDIQQIVTQYGQANAQTILEGSCITKLFFPGMSIKMAENLSKRAGQKTIISEVDGVKQSYHRELITPSELIQLKPKQGVLLHGNYPPCITNIRPFFKSKKLKKKTQIPVPILPRHQEEFPQLLLLSDNHGNV